MKGKDRGDFVKHDKLGDCLILDVVGEGEASTLIVAYVQQTQAGRAVRFALMPTDAVGITEREKELVALQEMLA